MQRSAAVSGPHSGGEAGLECPGAPQLPAPPIVVATQGRRFHVEWDPQDSVTALDQLVFFSRTKTGAKTGATENWCHATENWCQVIYRKLEKSCCRVVITKFGDRLGMA